MSAHTLQNYYQILGISSSATDAEIKTAFRILAKAYHPDLNPHGKEKFAIILKAYEVLSDPKQKYVYDYKLEAANRPQSAAHSEARKARMKDNRSEEQELKRRQYYNDYIKKYEKKRTEAAKTDPITKSYNDYKYLLFATPLAIVLLLIIVRFSNETNQMEDVDQEQTAAKELATETSSDIIMGDAPYVWHFGQQIYDTSDKGSLVIRNLCGADAIVCIFKHDQFIRCCFLQSGYSAEISQLPIEDIKLRYCTGNKFRHNLKIAGTDITGGFSDHSNFFGCKQDLDLGDNIQLTLEPGINEGFMSLTPEEFFKKSL